MLKYLKLNDIGDRLLIFVNDNMGDLVVKEVIPTASSQKLRN